MSTNKPAPTTGVHEKNNQLREAYLRCNQQIAHAKATNDGPKLASVLKERERISEEFFTRNHRLVFNSIGNLATMAPAEDLAQAAYLAFWEAFAGKTQSERDGVIENPDGTLSPTGGWDHTRTTFGTWLHSHVRGAAQREVHKLSAQSTIPYGDWTARPKVIAAVHELTEKHGRTPTSEEIAKHLGIRKRIVENARVTSVSLEQPVSSSPDTTSRLGDLLAAEPLPTTVDRPDAAERFAQEADQLTAQEICVKLLRDDLITENPRTSVVTGNLLGIGRGVVANDLKRASEKLA